MESRAWFPTGLLARYRSPHLGTRRAKEKDSRREEERDGNEQARGYTQQVVQPSRRAALFWNSMWSFLRKFWRARRRFRIWAWNGAHRRRVTSRPLVRIRCVASRVGSNSKRSLTAVAGLASLASFCSDGLAGSRHRLSTFIGMVASVRSRAITFVYAERKRANSSAMNH